MRTVTLALIDRARYGELPEDLAGKLAAGDFSRELTFPPNEMQDPLREVQALVGALASAEKLVIIPVCMGVKPDIDAAGFGEHVAQMVELISEMEMHFGGSGVRVVGLTSTDSALLEAAGLRRLLREGKP